MIELTDAHKLAIAESMLADCKKVDAMQRLQIQTLWLALDQLARGVYYYESGGGVKVGPAKREELMRQAAEAIKGVK